MARVQLFLSTVSAEFLSYRERLRHLPTCPDVEVKVQEDFIVTGNETLEMLDAYIQGCDGVSPKSVPTSMGCDASESGRFSSVRSDGGSAVLPLPEATP